MPYYPRANNPPARDESWKCSQCGRELTGRSMPRRSLLNRELSSTGQSMHSKCISCGYIMCSPCLEMQKPSDIMPDRDALCPDCGKTFGDGPILLPAGHTSYIAPSPAEQAASVEAGTFDYVKDLRSWAGWLIFWTVVNTGGMFFGGGGEEELPELSAGEMAVATALGCALIGVGILVFISAIVCLATRPPWPGFYIIFGIYLISIGLLNLTGGGFWSGLGIFQLVISITLFVRYAKYLNAHRAMREFY